MNIFYIPKPTQYLKVTTTVLTINKHIFYKLINWEFIEEKVVIDVC